MSKSATYALQSASDNLGLRPAMFQLTILTVLVSNTRPGVVSPTTASGPGGSHDWEPPLMVGDGHATESRLSDATRRPTVCKEVVFDALVLPLN